MTYSVTLLPMGRGDIPGPELFWMRAWDEWHPLLFQIALIRGDGVTALVNTGPAADIGPMNANWEQVLGERSAMRREPGEFVLDHLDRLGIAPEEITHVLLTPLQLYTVSNVPAFTEAQICLSRRGWVHFHTTHDHPQDDRASSIPDEVLVHLVTEAWPRVRLLEDEDEVVPGVRTWACGGHHRASMVVEVDTPRGVAAISDVYFHLANVERNHPVGTSVSVEEAAVAYRRVRDTADLVVPLFDPGNMERFPEGRIA